MMTLTCAMPTPFSGAVAGKDVAYRFHGLDEPAGGLGVGRLELGGAGLRRIQRLRQARTVRPEPVQFALQTGHRPGVIQPPLDGAFENLERRAEPP